MDQNWTSHHTTEKQRCDWCPEVSEQFIRHPLLSKPSEPHPILNEWMTIHLRQIMLVSDGAVMALKVRTTGSRAEASAPTSDLATTIDKLGERYMACKTHSQRLEVIKEAQDTADRLRYAPNRRAVRGTLEWREAIAQDSRSSRVLAGVYGIDARTVQRIKKDAGTNRQHGGVRQATRLAARKQTA